MAATEIQQALAAEERLAVTLGDYTGRWVAVRDHRVVNHAETLNALLERVEPDLADIDRIFEVGDPGGICFL
jgi:hypothetical protein